MKKREVSSKKYILSAMIVSLIFILGITLGLIIENKRVEYLMNFYEEEKNDFESLQVQYMYLTSGVNNTKVCTGLEYTFNEYLIRLDKKGSELENYRVASSSLNREKFNILLRQYLIEEVKSWTLATRIKKTCSNHEIVTVLNFHTKRCPECDDTGTLLSYFKKKFKQNLLVFSFDADFTDEPLVQMLERVYNITEYPTLIINDKKYEGFMNKQELQNVLCNYYNQSNNPILKEKCNS